VDDKSDGSCHVNSFECYLALSPLLSSPQTPSLWTMLRNTRSTSHCVISLYLHNLEVFFLFLFSFYLTARMMVLSQSCTVITIVTIVIRVTG
jgi:hypothetical protein